MDVQIEDLIRERAALLGDGVPYALKVLIGQLAEDPDRGRPASFPLGRVVLIDGETFEDCPALVVHYIREPERVRIVAVRPSPPEAPPGGDRHHDRGQGPRDEGADEAVVVRQVEDAWGRIAAWLAAHAPASHAALRPGLGGEAVEAFGWGLGVRIPAELRALWRLVAGDDGVGWAGCLPGNTALMSLEQVGGHYRERMRGLVPVREGEDAQWRASWIPVISRDVRDRTSGLHLDVESGFLGRWSRYRDDEHLEERDTLLTYLEDMADMLHSPALAVRDAPGLLDGALVWRSGLDPAQDGVWRPLAG
ncbi:hypothetical protein ACIPQJ_00790 [Streptomyces sp. NPDC090082]|uniref:hypothetical protein n=1 Tax=unclassified Streptomyces TaxID=2593676 RepID=UPI00381D4264